MASELRTQTAIRKNILGVDLRTPIRRPHSTIPPPLPKGLNYPQPKCKKLPQPDNIKFAPFLKLFTGDRFSDKTVFQMIYDNMSFDIRFPAELKSFINYLFDMLMHCSVNAVPIFKSLYVFTQHRLYGHLIRIAVFTELEARFEDQSSIRNHRDAFLRIRNFIKVTMAIAHHYRNLNIAPFLELIQSMAKLAEDLAPLEYFDDVPLYVTLILRVNYYFTLKPGTYKDGVPQIVIRRNQWKQGILREARANIRKKIADHREISESVKMWALLLIDAKNAPDIEKDEEIMEQYQKLPGIDALLKKGLTINLPSYCDTVFNLAHIREFINFE